MTNFAFMATHTLPQELYVTFLDIINTSGIEQSLNLPRHKVYNYRKEDRHSNGVILEVLYLANRLQFTNEPTTTTK